MWGSVGEALAWGGGRCRGTLQGPATSRGPQTLPAPAILSSSLRPLQPSRTPSSVESGVQPLAPLPCYCGEEAGAQHLPCSGVSLRIPAGVQAAGTKPQAAGGPLSCFLWLGTKHPQALWLKHGNLPFLVSPPSVGLTSRDSFHLPEPTCQVQGGLPMLWREWGAFSSTWLGQASPSMGLGCQDTWASCAVLAQSGFLGLHPAASPWPGRSWERG